MKKISLIIFSLFVYFFIKAQSIPAWKITDVANYYNKKNDSIYIINFWATFCKPCVAEIPYLQSITKKYAGQKVKLLLVSLDLPAFYPRKIESFAKKNNFTADIVWLNESDADHFCPVIDKKWSGSMPATIFVNAATGYKKFIESGMSEEMFEKELRNAIRKD
jgi:thiol-disulfide isomerase/thioredoxin